MTVKKMCDKLLMFLQHAIGTILACACDPDPEGGYKVYQKVKDVRYDVGWLPLLSLACALGILSVAYANTAARYGKTSVDIFFWLGLLLIFVPVAVRLLSPIPSRFERISLLCLVGCCLYLVKIISSPLYFSAHDEFLHLRTAEDIARSGHLFNKNSLLPVSPHYPGLELITNALSSMSGMSIFGSGIIVIGVARILMVLACFLLSEQLSSSSRQASIATVLYMCNPHFLIFDVLFSYESLALPLSIFAIFALTCQKITRNHCYQMMLIVGIALTAIACIHHVTDYILNSLLIFWSVMCLFRRHTPIRQTNPVGAALFGVCVAIANGLLFSNPVVGYLSSFSGGAFSELGNVLIHANGARHLFVDYAGQTTPLWERVFMFSSVLLIVLCLPFGLLGLWQRYRNHALICAFGIASLLYPVSQLFRLTKSGSEISDRAAAFLFLPISFILAIFIVQFFPVRRLSWLRASLLCCVLSALFLGGAIFGIGPPWALLPGPYLVEADERSIEPQGIQAALWAKDSIGPNNRVATDRVNQLLMSTYGDQYVMTHIQDQLDVTPVFFSSKLGPVERELLQRARLHYLVVDLRLSKALPRFGFYFEQGEPASFQRTVPVNQEALTKFRNNSLINQIFDSGDIGIYDVGDLANAHKKY